MTGDLNPAHDASVGQMFDVLKRSPGLRTLILYDLVHDDTHNQYNMTTESVEISLPVLQSLTLHVTGLALTKSLIRHAALPSVREITLQVAIDSERAVADFLTTSAERHLQGRLPASIRIVDLTNSYHSYECDYDDRCLLQVRNLTRDVKSPEAMLLFLEESDLSMLLDLCVIFNGDLSADWWRGGSGRASALDTLMLDGPVNPTGLISALTPEKTIQKKRTIRGRKREAKLTKPVVDKPATVLASLSELTLGPVSFTSKNDLAPYCDRYGRMIPNGPAKHLACCLQRRAEYHCKLSKLVVPRHKADLDELGVHLEKYVNHLSYGEYERVDCWPSDYEEDYEEDNMEEGEDDDEELDIEKMIADDIYNRWEEYQ